MIQQNGKISHALGIGRILLIWPYFPKQLQTKCYPYQVTHDIFHRTRTNNPKIHIESPSFCYLIL